MIKKENSKLLQNYIEEIRRPRADPQFETPINWAGQIAKNAGLTSEDDKWKILVVPPSPNVYREIEVGVNILVNNEKGGYTTRPASSISPTLERIHNVIQEDQLKIRVFVHPSLSDDIVEALKISARDFLLDELILDFEEQRDEFTTVHTPSGDFGTADLALFANGHASYAYGDKLVEGTVSSIENGLISITWDEKLEEDTQMEASTYKAHVTRKTV